MEEQHPHEQHEPKKDFHEEIKAIYEDTSGEMPNLTTLERRNDSWVTRMLVRLIVALVVLAGAAWAGFFLWNRGVFDSGKPLEVSMEGPSEVKAGEVAYFTVRYHNNGNVPIGSLELKMNLPIGFELRQANPSPSDGTTWQLDSLSPDSDGSVVLSGVFRSEVPSTQTLQAFFTYRPANFTSDFQGIASIDVSIPDSLVDLAVTGPEKALPGDEVSYTINVQNTGLEKIANVRIEATPPSGFTPTGAEPASIKPDLAQWDIAELAPGALTAITLKGRFTNTASGDQVMAARAALVTTDGTLLTQKTGQVTTDVLGGNLSFHLIVNGSSTDLTTDLGDRLRVSIDYGNSGNEAIGGVAFTLHLTTPSGKAVPIDWATADLAGGTRSGNDIVWDASVKPEFASLQPTTSGLLDLTLPLLSTLDLASVSDRVNFTLSADLEKVGSVDSPRTVETSPVGVAINSDLNASAEARYYLETGEPVGTGPLPPKVGETTTYRIFWNVANTLHPLTDLHMSAVLPQDVAWTGNTNAEVGTITYNETTRVVTWTVDRLPTETTAAQATFDIAINPDAGDVGSFFKLVNATSVDATDETTTGHLSQAIDLITTELANDDIAKGKGVVVN